MCMYGNTYPTLPHYETLFSTGAFRSNVTNKYRYLLIGKHT
jgi:hypothetical protein